MGGELREEIVRTGRRRFLGSLACALASGAADPASASPAGSRPPESPSCRGIARPRRTVRIVHGPSGLPIAEGPLGWGITPFEGNFYIRRKHLLTDRFRPNWIPGVCVYKFLYVWLDLAHPDGTKSRNLGWMYWLPNPLLPFIWYRVAVPRHHPEIEVQESFR